MNAKEARKLAQEKLETITAVKIGAIMKAIAEEVNKGNFSCDFNIFPNEVKKKLEEMGYVVQKKGTDDYPNSTSSYRVIW